MPNQPLRCERAQLGSGDDCAAAAHPLHTGSVRQPAVKPDSSIGARPLAGCGSAMIPARDNPLCAKYLHICCFSTGPNDAAAPFTRPCRRQHALACMRRHAACRVRPGASAAVCLRLSTLTCPWASVYASARPCHVVVAWLADKRERTAVINHINSS